MRGILMAGGSGSRLGPLTEVASKQLLPVFDKPLIYYPLSTLLLAGIRDIAIVSSARDAKTLAGALGDGSQWGIRLEYVTQECPRGIADGLVLCREFLDGSSCCMVLGDNIFHGAGFGKSLSGIDVTNRATIFGFRVLDIHRFGAVTLDDCGRPTSIVEKPPIRASGLAVPGLYFYPPDCVSRAERLTPSVRGELEITDLNVSYLAESRLDVRILPRGTAWIDAGTPSSLARASQLMQLLQEETGQKFSVPEEIAYRSGWIGSSQLESRANHYRNSDYGNYLTRLVESGREGADVAHG